MLFNHTTYLLCFKPYVTQMAASIIKALVEPISVINC